MQLDPPGTFRAERADAVASLTYAAVVHERDPAAATAALRTARERATTAGVALRRLAAEVRPSIERLATRGDLTGAEATAAERFLSRVADHG